MGESHTLLRLRAARKAAGISQQRLSELAACSTATVRLVEGGWVPSDEMIDRLAGALGIASHELFQEHADLVAELQPTFDAIGRVALALEAVAQHDTRQPDYDGLVEELRAALAHAKEVLGDRMTATVALAALSRAGATQGPAAVSQGLAGLREAEPTGGDAP